jgi:hypothetical protein
MAEPERPFAEDAKGRADEYVKTNPVLLFGAAHAAIMEAAHHLLVAEPAEKIAEEAKRAGRAIPKSVIPKLALATAKMAPGVLLTGVGTVLGDVIEGRLDPAKKLSPAKIAGHAAINLATTTALEAVLVAVGFALGGPIGAVAGAAVGTVLGTMAGDFLFDRFIRPDAVAMPADTAASIGNSTATQSPGSSPQTAPVPLDDFPVLSRAALQDSGRIPHRTPGSIARKRPSPVLAMHRPETSPGIIVTVGGEMPGQDGRRIGGRPSVAGTINLQPETGPALALPGAVPHGTYALTRLLLDGGDMDEPRQPTLELAGTGDGSNFPSANSPFRDEPGRIQALPGGIDMPLLSLPAAGGHPRRIGLIPAAPTREMPDRGGAGVIVPIEKTPAPKLPGSFESGLGPLGLRRPPSDASQLGHPAGLPPLDRQSTLLPDPFARSHGVDPSGRTGTAEIIAAIGRLGDRLEQRPVKAFLDGRDVTDAVNSHNARWSNAPIGGTSAFDSSAGFTPIGAHTD